jgi:signal transduction histidine kinase
MSAPRRRPPTRESLFALADALRTPLTALQLGVDVLGRPELGALTGPQRDVLQTLEDEVGRLRALVDHALDIKTLGTYTGPYERAPLDLGELAKDAVAPIVDQARGRSIHVRVKARVKVVVHGHRLHLAWVIATLAGNALRYAPAGSSIDVSVVVRREAAIVRVRDRGPGMPPEIRRQLEQRNVGSAFALVMIAEIAERHGGMLRIPDAEGETVVELHLPRAPRFEENEVKS